MVQDRDELRQLKALQNATGAFKLLFPEQLKTGWLSDLSSDMVVEPCQLDTKSDARLIFQSVALLAHTPRGELDIAEFIEVCNKVTDTKKTLRLLPFELRVRSIKMALVLPRLSPPIPLKK